MATLTAIFRAQDNLSNAMTKAGNAGSKATGIMQKLGKIGSVAMKGIVTAVTAAGTALLAFGKKAIDVGMNFETSMSQVMATMGIDKDSTFETSTGEIANSYEMLSAAAEKMGAETAFTSSQAADALNYLALAGYDAEQATAALPTVLHLAGAGGMELSAASDMITDSMAALGMEVNQVNLDRFADQMAKTASTTNTSVSQLGEAVLTVGATAANLRNGTTELNTQLGILANVGIKGAEGGTHLRNILLRLQNPTAKASKQLKKLGVDVYDADGKMRDTGAIFEDLKNSMEGMTQAEIDQVMSTIFNKTDIAAANALLAASGDEYNRIFGIIQKSGGAAAEMYKTMLDNLKGDVDIFNSATEALYLSIYKSMNGTLRELVQTGTSYINRLNDAFNEGGFEGLVTELGSVLGDATSVILSYAPKLIQAGTSIILAFVDSIGENADAIADAAVEIGTQLLGAVLKIGPKLGGAFLKIVGAAARSLTKALPKLFKAVPDKFYKAFGLDKNKFVKAVNKFSRNIGKAITKLFKGDFGGALTNVGMALGVDAASITKIKAAFTQVKGWATDTFRNIKSAFGEGYAKGGLFGGISSAWGALKSSFAKVDWGSIGRTAWASITSAFGNASDLVKKLTLGEDYTPEATWSDVGNKIWNEVQNAFGTAGDLLKKLVLGNDYTPESTWSDVGNKIWTSVQSAFGTASELLKKLALGNDYTPESTWADVGNKIWSAVQGAFGTAADLLKKLILGSDYTPDSTWSDAGNKIWGAVQSAFGTAGDLLKKLVLGSDYTPESTWSDVGGKIWSAVQGAFGSAGDLLKKLVLGGDYTPESTWADVGNKIWGAVQGAFGSAGDLLKKLVLGNDYTPESTWADVGNKIWSAVQGAFGTAGDLLKKLVLGSDYTPESTWGDVGNKIWSAVQGAFGTASELLKKLVLGNDYTPESTWADVGGKIWGLVQGAFGTANELLKKLVLGDDYTPDESWKSVGSKIWDKIKEGLESASAEGGVLGTLASALESALGVAESIATTVSSAVDTLRSNGTIGSIWTSVKSIVQSILDIVQEVVSAFTGSTEGAGDASNGIVSAVQLISDAVAAMATGLEWLSKAVQALNDAGALVPILEGIGGAILTYFTASAIMNVVNFFKAFSAGSAIFAALNPHILAIAAALGALIALISWAHDQVKLEDKTWGDYKEFDLQEIEITAMADLNPKVTNGEEAMQAINDQIAQMVERGTFGEDIGAKLSDLFSQYMTPEGMDWEAWYESGHNAAMELLNGVSEGVSSDAGNMPNPAEDLMASVNETIAQATGQTIDFTNMYSGVDTAAEQAATDALATLNGISEGLNTAGFDTAGGEAGQGYAQGLQNTDTSGAAAAMVNATEQAVRSAQASGSPAAAFMPMGAEAAQGYGMGLQQEDVSGYASAFIATIATALTTSAAAINLTAQGVSIMRTLLTGMTSVRGAILSGARATGSGIRSTFSSVNLTSVGSNIMRGLLNGMNSMFSTLLSRARQMAAQLKQTIKSGMEVASPSKFTTWVGQMTGQGMVEGIEASTNNVMDAAASMVQGVRSAFEPMEVSAPTIATPSVGGITTPNEATTSPYRALGDNGGQAGGASEKHITIDVNGSGRISVNGVSKEQVLDMLVENLKPVLMNILSDEAFEGGDGVYEF